MYQNILVPLDGSPVAEEAIPYALELHPLSGGTIALARVVPSAVEPPARCPPRPIRWFVPAAATTSLIQQAN